MSGNELKKRLAAMGYNLTKVAELMGESPQSLNSKLNAKDVKSGVLERIAEALNKSIATLYGESNYIGDNTVYNSSIINSHINSNITQQEFKENIIAKDKEISHLREIIANKEEIISLLKQQLNKSNK